MSYDNPQAQQMKILGLFAVSLLATQALSAQESGKTLVNELVKHWEISKSFTVEVAEAMPQDAYGFKASDAEMTFGEQMNHIALGNGNYCAAAMGAKNPLTKGSDNTKTTAIKNLTQRIRLLHRRSQRHDRCGSSDYGYDALGLHD